MKKFTTAVLVDDDNVINFINEKTLKLSDFSENIISFQSGEETIKYLSENCHCYNDSEVSTVIFLDLNMPGMDGWEFLDEIQRIPEFSKEICKIYILSSSIDPMDFEKAKEYDIVQDFISKPLTKERLQEIKDKL
jgi:CheY-like chemotaxis protein